MIYSLLDISDIFTQRYYLFKKKNYNVKRCLIMMQSISITKFRYFKYEIKKNYCKQNCKKMIKTVNVTCFPPMKFKLFNLLSNNQLVITHIEKNLFLCGKQYYLFAYNFI